MSQGHRLNSPVFFCMPSISIVKKKAAEVGKEASRSCPTKKVPDENKAAGSDSFRKAKAILFGAASLRIFSFCLLHTMVCRSFCGFLRFAAMQDLLVRRFESTSRCCLQLAAQLQIRSSSFPPSAFRLLSYILSNFSSWYSRGAWRMA